MKTLNIIGAGNVGKTLAKLWSQANVFSIGDILNRSKESSQSAVEFIGAGHAIDDLSVMTEADIYLISTPDDYIVQTCEQLSASGLLKPDNIVFHCSGSLPSSELIKSKQAGAFIGSIHPIKSIADIEDSVKTFTGTFCGSEGDQEALHILIPAFEAIGGKTFQIDPQHKTIYHTASVFVCNYLTALLEVSIQSYIKAGLDRETAMQVIEPIAKGTIENIFKLGTSKALTGPIARGDSSVISKQITALEHWNPQFHNLYLNLGQTALELSRQQGTASKEQLQTLNELFNKS